MIYLITLLILVFLSARYDFNSEREFSNKWYNLVLIVLILIAGLRYKVGGDTIEYFSYFESIKPWSDTNISDIILGKYALLWNVFATTCKTLSKDFYVLQIIQASFVNLTIFWFIKKYSKYKFTSVLIYFIFIYLYFNFEILRESIAVSLFLIAYSSFERKKWLNYYIIILVAFLFHPSAIILFLAPFINLIKFSVESLFISGFIFLLIIYTFSTNTGLVEELLFSEVLETKFHQYSKYSFNLNGIIYSFISYILFPLYIIIQNKKINEDKKMLFKNMLLFYFIITFTYITAPGLGRFFNYMTPFMMIYLADFLNNIYTYEHYNKFKRIYIVSIFLIVIFPKYLYYSADTSRFYPDTHKYDLWYPYSSIFTKTEYKYRETIFYESIRESSEKHSIKSD